MAWEATHSITVKDLDRRAVWNAWADVDHWHRWDTDIEYARLDGDLREGQTFTLKPRGGPNVKIMFTRLQPLAGYTDLVKFPLARMTGIHDMAETPEGVRLTVTIRVEGPLAWLWRRIVAQGVADEAPAQLRALVDYAQRQTSTAAA